MKAKGNTKEEAINHGVRLVRAAGRKDRHSKVCTARGAKDRRVRLSPKTAILFYDVQDRLGYDRPSKAIDWLMKEAKAAIDALDQPPPPAAAESDHHQMLSWAAPPLSSSISRSQDYHEQPTPVEVYDANSEIITLQRIFHANAGGGDVYSSVVSAAAPLHCPASLHNEREPLQSSYWKINESSPQLQGFRFSEHDQLGLTNSSSSFLHYEE